jgi:hypothetical protein
VKVKSFFYISFFIISVFWGSIGLLSENNNILNIIKSCSFGLDNEEELVIYDKNNRFCISDSGYVFISNSYKNNICKFTLDGKFITRFGQKGEGPGDLYAPGNMSILDNKYILVEEYATKRRISMFDLNGKFIKIIRTKKSVWHIGVLNKNNIYYLNEKIVNNENIFFYGHKSNVIIKSLKSNKETVILKHHFIKSNYMDKKVLVFALGKARGCIKIVSLPLGELFIAITDTPIIKKFSYRGELKKTIYLKLLPKSINKNIIKKYKNYTIKFFLKDVKNNNRMSASYKNKFINSIKSLPYEKFFDKYLPYYDDFLVDKNGNIIIIINSWWSKDIWVKLYSSKDGSLIKQKKYIDKRYKFDTKKLVYSPKYGLYGFFQKRNSEDVDIRIVKLNWD